MRISVIGTGYVGLVTGTCFADSGNDVWCVDIDADKIARLERGEVPIYEPGLDEMVARNVEAERLRFTTDLAAAVRDASIVYVCVGTPPRPDDGGPDMTHVYGAVEDVGRAMDQHKVVVLKSTVPVGTAAEVKRRLAAVTSHEFDVVSNPEFLKEGAAIDDFLKPDRVVIGTSDVRVAMIMKELYDPFTRTGNPMLVMDNESAELTKYASNALLATRISFMNELANLADLVGADINLVRQGMGTDGRIGGSFLFPGVGFGGSCLVGDETVLVRRGEGPARLVGLARLFDELAPDADDEPEPRAVAPDRLEALSWDPEEEAPAWRPVAAVTRRPYEGEAIEVRTDMGRRVRCTPDHPFVVAAADGERRGVELAEGLAPDDWLPLALDRAPSRAAPPRRFDLAAAAGRLGFPPDALGTAENGTHVPATLEADAAFWRVAGLYIAQGHRTIDGRRHRLHWSFHPTDGDALVREVETFWRRRGVRADVHRAPTSTHVTVSSALLAAWWTEELGLGGDRYGQRLPDATWDLPEEHRRALLSGVWHGDGSWSYVDQGPSVVLEYATASRELADGLLRLLGELGVVGRLTVGRTARSTVDTYWLVVSGAAQVEALLDLVPPPHRDDVTASTATQAKQIAPTDHRRRRDAAAWVRVAETTRHPFQGFVYSLEVPGAETFVTTHGLVVHNCFPKDVDALGHTAQERGLELKILEATNAVNRAQKRVLFEKIRARFGDDLSGRKVAVWGLAFKPRTDDMREAPSLTIVEALLQAGAEVHAHDPEARETAREHLGDRVTYGAKPYDVLGGADCLALVTEWNEFRRPDWERIKSLLKQPVVFDGRNIWEPERLEERGFEYYGIGRGRRLGEPGAEGASS